MTISRCPRRSSCAPNPLLPRSSESTTRGAPPPVTETASSFPFESAKIVEPSVLTTSGSSTPSSWLFVVEKVLVALPPLVCGAFVAVGGADVPGARVPGSTTGVTVGSGTPWVPAK